MAINIQEILHPSDSDNIKFSKINYNFDQLVANGGGPSGPKGGKGNQGTTGLTGQQGVLGDKGDKGNSGETTSPWKNIAIDLDVNDNKNNVRILKPKPGTDLETPVIWLGDSSFLDEGASASDGDTTLRSTLNVGRHFNLNTSSVEAEYATFWHSASHKIKLDSEDVTDGADVFVRYNLSPVEPIVQGDYLDIRFQINTHTVHTGLFHLDNAGAAGTATAGMLRYNSGGNKFEGYINNSWVELCTAPCGSGGSNASISIDGTNLDLNVDGTLVGSTPAFQYSNWTGSVAVDAAGVVAITNGNANTITTDPPSFSANTTAGTNSLSMLVTVTVPSGYSNVGSTVQGNETGVVQPTSYVSPSQQQYTLNLTEGSSTGSNWATDSASIVIANSNGATQTSVSYGIPTSVLVFDAFANTEVQIEINASVVSGRVFDADPWTITSSPSASIISQSISLTSMGATAVFNITVGASLTINADIEAQTSVAQLSGTANYQAGSDLDGACNGTGGGNTGIVVNVNVGATNAQWLAAAWDAIALDHSGRPNYSQNGWVTLNLLKDENNNTIDATVNGYDEAVQVASNGTHGAQQSCAPLPIFEWAAYPSGTGTNSGAPVYVDYDSTSGSNIQQFDWDGGVLEGGSAAASHFNWTNWTNMSTDPTIGIPAVYVSNSISDAENKIDNHTGGNGYAAFFFPWDTVTPSAQQGPIFNGLTFDGTSNQHGNITFDVVGSEINLWTAITPSCHLAGTVMNLADGTTKLVEDLEAGDILKSYSITGLGTDENEQPPSTYTADVSQWSAVESTTTVTFVNEGSFNEYYNFNNDLTKVTREHRVLVKDIDGGISFKRADAVINGDSFYIDSVWVEITNIEVVTPEVVVATYTIGVEDQDIYVADGIVWHNIPGEEK